jgi:CDP-diacylglycerol--glycerol-3-phosphate 3-phosphatidyltransferase
MVNIERARKTTSERITQPAIKLLVRTRLTPNAVTWIGFWLTVAAAALIVTGHLFAAGFVVLIAGFFDMLDGALARTTNRVTRFGGVLDSTLDRFSEAILFLSIMTVYIMGQQVAGSLLAGLALVGSFLVSYTRARIEILGIEGKVGIFTRTERVIILVLGLLLSQYNYVLMAALAIIAVFSFFTAGQRLFHAWRQTRAG